MYGLDCNGDRMMVIVTRHAGDGTAASNRKLKMVMEVILSYPACIMVKMMAIITVLVLGMIKAKMMTQPEYSTEPKRCVVSVPRSMALQ
ncbi:hypothetical protein E2C01_045149 [Portunus trituberculatus]|uniref:Uncharacterized protein n=1 Tax=Portunus trituberculatus TaxID=210409 RepID=A0A5B7G497_PORTR|nr:hypothetical protein [Portunus trituberculatus]